MIRNVVGRLTVGGLIIFLGILLLLSTTGIVEVESVWSWVPLLFVLLGLWVLVRTEFRNLVGPMMVVAVAGTFLARNLGVITDGTVGTWWPLFIVLFGLLIIVNRSRRRQRIRLEGQGRAHEVTAIGVFGSDDRRVTSDRFTGAEIVSVFGDTRLDLRDAVVRTPPAIVEAVTVFGDTEVRVPMDWDVELETLTVFGESVDRRSPSKVTERKRERERGGEGERERGGEGEREREDEGEREREDEGEREREDEGERERGGEREREREGQREPAHTDGRPDVIVTGLTLFGDVEIRD